MFPLPHQYVTSPDLIFREVYTLEERVNEREVIRSDVLRTEAFCEETKGDQTTYF